MKRRTFLSAATATLAALPRLANAMGNDVPAGGAPGVRMIEIPGGYRVWTEEVGPKPANVLLLHGGPGFSHDYLDNFRDFLPDAGIGFYFYDQLGCGNSDRPNDDSLWTIARYTSEVEAVRKGLGLDKMILYGHSWGGMLAIEYALKYPQNLERLVISNMTASIPSFGEYLSVLRNQLSPADQATLAKYEKLKAYDDPAYQAVMNKVYAQHIIRLKQWPPPVQRAFENANMRIYNLMQGPNEFVITGTYKNWDRWADLHKIKVPALVMGAKYGEMSPDQIRREGKLIPHAKTWISSRGSHLTMWDDQDAYFNRLIPFLKTSA